MTIFKKTKKGAIEAHQNYSKISELRGVTANYMLEIGRLFKENRDKKYYELLGHETFNSFLADPTISFGRSTVYLYIRIYETYILKLKQSPEFLSDIGIHRLQIIQPVVDKDTTNCTEWLYKARELSLSDLRTEAWEAQGKVMPQEAKGTSEFNTKHLELPPVYIKYVELHPCIFHPDRKSEGHHFPRTKGAEGKDTWKKIPLCRECHAEYHCNAKEFLWQNRVKIFNFFYDLIKNMEDDIFEQGEIIKKLNRSKK